MTKEKPKNHHSYFLKQISFTDSNQKPIEISSIQAERRVSTGIVAPIQKPKVNKTMMRSNFRLIAWFLALPALLLPLIYVFGIVKVESNFVVVQTVTAERRSSSQNPNPPTPTARQQNGTSNTETSPNEYNLMEETYGRKWDKDRAAMYLLPNDCTMGMCV